MKNVPHLTISILIFILVLAGAQPVHAAGVCDTNPCLNGGVCTELSGYDFSCACPDSFLGPSCALTAESGENIIAEYNEGSVNGGSLGWHTNNEGKSGVGQLFTAMSAGLLKRVTIEASVSQEAIDEAEGLVIEFWNVDESGIPTGSPLAGRTIEASSFSAVDVNEIKTVDFSSEAIMLSAQGQYAFSMSVLNRADIAAMYDYPYVPEGTYPGGAMLLFYPISGISLHANEDLRVFEVTAEIPPFADGFEALGN